MNQSMNDEGVCRTAHTCKFDVVFRNIMIDDFMIYWFFGKRDKRLSVHRKYIKQKVRRALKN